MIEALVLIIACVIVIVGIVAYVLVSFYSVTVQVEREKKKGLPFTGSQPKRIIYWENWVVWADTLKFDPYEEDEFSVHLGGGDVEEYMFVGTREERP